jgi:bisphosphoglycerate-independent phosphoglycerate mutase (AlkP superfamily)
MSHELAEKTAGLASRVNNLAVKQTGDSCRQLLSQQDKLIKLEMAVIVQNLDCEKPAYQKAIDGLNKAIKAVEAADKDISKVADAIKRVKQAIDVITKALEATVA